MNNFFLKLFDFFRNHKTLLWLLLAAVVALLAFSASRIRFVEDISSFLPNNADSKRVNEAYQHIGAANKIIVTFSQKDTLATNGVDRDLLSDAATRFAEILQKSDSAGHIKDILYEIDNEKISAVTDFITQNLPYFLEEGDYLRIDSLIQPQAIESQLKADKELLMSPMGGFVRNVVLNDPLHFSQNALKNLDIFKFSDNANIDNGFIFNSKGECLVTITSKYPVSETAGNKLLANEIYDAVNKTVSEFKDQVKIVPFGAALISITNADQIKKDSIFAVSVAVALILLLLFYFFRNVKSLFFIVLTVLFGGLFSFGIIVLFKSTVSIIAIGVSSIIFGIAMNYPLHFLAHHRHEATPLQALKEVVNPLLIGCITTIGAFLSLLFISSDAMKDLGLFASFLLAGTLLFVLIFLPHLAGKPTLNRFQKSGRIRKISEFAPERNKFIVLTVLALSIVLFFFSFGTQFDSNLQSINYMTKEQREQMNELMEENKGKTDYIYFVVAQEKAEEALRIYEKEVLHGDVYRYFKGSVSGIGNYVPSDSMQEEKINRWNDFWKSRKEPFLKNLNEAAAQQSFNKGVFGNFTETLDRDFRPQSFEYFYGNLNSLANNYIYQADGKYFISTIVAVPSQQLTVANKYINDPKYRDVTVFNNTSIAQKLVNALSADFNYVLYICSFIVFAFLFFSLGRIEITFLTFLPMIVGWVWILGMMNIFGLKFNIVNIILATFIFGQGNDYTIFVTEGLVYEYARRKKLLGLYKYTIAISASMLFIAIGMLVFAKHPAMRSLAEVTIVGMASVVGCAFLFPPLVFRFLTTKKGKFREVPWTLWRFLKMAYSFVVFLIGTLLTTIYGLALFGLRKKASERNKMRYHRLLRWAADFVIRRVPDVKFRYENLSGETFDKPAVIISNHQSHLDLMCLMMLTPKLIILTNDWVWRSPFYGRIIRYADFYPVLNGIENSIERLREAVDRGYSIVVFPEGTRSVDCSIGRFHRGAFYLAEKLGLDIVPVFLHGAGHVLPKNDFLLRKGQITVQVRERITPSDSRFAADYTLRAKQVRQYYRETFSDMAKGIETLDYFDSFVRHNYIYKGLDLWREVKKEFGKTKEIKELDEGRVLIENNGYGVFSFLYALSNKQTQVVALEEDRDKVDIARGCLGLPKNLTIYHTSEWETMSS